MHNGLSEDVKNLLIRNSLKHLSAKLYSYRHHFIEELIQNSEDTDYEKGVTPSVCVTLNPKYILFANNEIGFTPKNIVSICSIYSSKLPGQHIGQKV